MRVGAVRGRTRKPMNDRVGGAWVALHEFSATDAEEQSVPGSAAGTLIGEHGGAEQGCHRRRAGRRWCGQQCHRVMMRLAAVVVHERINRGVETGDETGRAKMVP